MRTTILVAVAAGLAFADAPGRFASQYSNSDFALTADPNAAQWKGIPGIIAENGPRGERVPGHRTDIRSRWTINNLYLLFICPYEKLNLRPNPSADTETNNLWDWDVAEAFIGSDFKNIHRYKEFELSPQGEWVDLDIDSTNLSRPDPGWRWNSGFKVKARIDSAAKVWYGEMRIPWTSIDSRPPQKGNELRINLYRCQGPKADRKFIAWQPTGKATYHVPESFGRLVLE